MAGKLALILVLGVCFLGSLDESHADNSEEGMPDIYDVVVGQVAEPLVAEVVQCHDMAKGMNSRAVLWRLRNWNVDEFDSLVQTRRLRYLTTGIGERFSVGGMGEHKSPIERVGSFLGFLEEKCHPTSFNTHNTAGALELIVANGFLLHVRVVLGDQQKTLGIWCRLSV